MQVRLNIYKQDINSNAFREISRIGHELFEYLKSPLITKAFSDANAPGNSSSKVQDVFLQKAIELGFQSERKRLFSDIPTHNLRPDYYRPVGNSGIILEVERGKTIMNNMDMLDMWKCHLCKSANHLFLFVPNQLKHNSQATAYDCFRRVSDRLLPFFETSNFTNVHSLWIFGY